MEAATFQTANPIQSNPNQVKSEPDVKLEANSTELRPNPFQSIRNQTPIQLIQSTVVEWRGGVTPDWVSGVQGGGGGRGVNLKTREGKKNQIQKIGLILFQSEQRGKKTFHLIVRHCSRFLFRGWFNGEDDEEWGGGFFLP